MLDKLTKQKSLFKVPENYFENFNAEMMDKLPVKEQVKVVPLWKKVLPWTAAAAVLSGLIFSMGIFNKEDDMVAHKASSKENPIHEKSIASTSVSSVDEDEYFQYLKEEATMSSYRDMIYNDY